MVLALAAAAWRWTPLAEIVAPDNLLSYTRAARDAWWAPLAMVAAYLAGTFVLFPRPLLTLVSVLTFGAWKGVALATAGVLLAALASYFAGRLLSRATVRRIAGDRIDSAAKPLREHGVVAVFGANMLPTPPFVVQNMIAGALRIPLWQFAAGTALALVPGIVAWTVFGDQLVAAFDDRSKVSMPTIAVTVVALAAFVFFARRWAHRRGF